MSSSVARQPECGDVDVAAARYVVRVRPDGSRYVGRSKGIGGDVTNSKHRHRVGRRHRLPGDEDAIRQWRRLASHLSNTLTTSPSPLTDVESLVLCDEKVTVTTVSSTSRHLEMLPLYIV